MLYSRILESWNYNLALIEFTFASMIGGIAVGALIVAFVYRLRAERPPAPSGTAGEFARKGARWVLLAGAVTFVVLCVVYATADRMWTAPNWTQEALEVYSLSSLRIVPYLPFTIGPLAVVTGIVVDVLFYMVSSQELSTAENLRHRLSRVIEYARSRTGAPVVVAAHSQGSVVAVDVIGRARANNAPTATCLITAGSPVDALYERFLGSSPEDRAAAEDLAFAAPVHWINFSREGDYIGAGQRRPGVKEINLGRGGHTGYWRSKKLWNDTLSELDASTLAAEPPPDNLFGVFKKTTPPQSRRGLCTRRYSNGCGAGRRDPTVGMATSYDLDRAKSYCDAGRQVKESDDAVRSLVLGLPAEGEDWPRLCGRRAALDSGTLIGSVNRRTVFTWRGPGVAGPLSPTSDTPVATRAACWYFCTYISREQRPGTSVKPPASELGDWKGTGSQGSVKVGGRDPTAATFFCLRPRVGSFHLPRPRYWRSRGGLSPDKVASRVGVFFARVRPTAIHGTPSTRSGMWRVGRSRGGARCAPPLCRRLASVDGSLSSSCSSPRRSRPPQDRPPAPRLDRLASGARCRPSCRSIPFIWR